MRGEHHMERKLPIGIQSFESIWRDGYLYVDKTAYVYKLAHEGKPYFLSRPRRFGKSLLVSTLKAYFEGKRDFFHGLAIERLEGNGPDAWQARPVFHLDFNGADYTRKGGLESKLEVLMRALEEEWGNDYSDLPSASRFQGLLGLAHKKSGHRVAVLIDEYDKPLLEAMHDSALEESNRATLKAFYSVLKSADEHLRFALLTGVTKFSKVSIFSDLNQLNDISLSAAYAGVCGITEDELLQSFGPEIDAMADDMGTSRTGCIDALRTQYDGYRFHPSGPGVYNPFSLLKALSEHEIGSYWFQTGTPTFLVERLREIDLDPRRLTDGTIYVDGDRISDYRADDPDPIPLLYQTGYLTIRDYDRRSGRYRLSVPNGEVELGLLKSLLPVSDWAEK